MQISALLFRVVVQMEQQFQHNDDVCHRKHGWIYQPTSR